VNIYIDIETIPGQSQAVLEAIREDAAIEKAAIRAPSNYKDQAKIDEYIASKRAEIDASSDERWRKTALDGAYGQIVVAAIAIDDATPVAFYRDNYVFAEREILRDLFAALDGANNLTRPTFIGHNLVGFDLRFIFQRAVINNVIPPAMIPFNARPWDETVFDTMTAWAGVGNRVSLDKLCGAFGLPKKGSEIGEEIDGSKVWDYVRSGRIADVAEYCKADVERTRALHRRMTFADISEAGQL
jgi:hypothetical protein